MWMIRGQKCHGISTYWPYTHGGVGVYLLCSLHSPLTVLLVITVLQAGRDSYMSCVIHYRILRMDSVPAWKCLRATASWSCEAALWAHLLLNSTYLWILSIAPHSYILSWCWWQHSAFQISVLPPHLLLLHLYFVTCQPGAFIKLFLLGFCADFKVVCLSLSLSFVLFLLTSRPIQLRIMSQMNQPCHRIKINLAPHLLFYNQGINWKGVRPQIWDGNIGRTKMHLVSLKPPSPAKNFIH